MYLYKNAYARGDIVSTTLMKGGTIRVFVMANPRQQPEKILGLYSIHADSVQAGDLPKLIPHP